MQSKDGTFKSQLRPDEEEEREEEGLVCIEVHKVELKSTLVYQKKNPSQQSRP